MDGKQYRKAYDFAKSNFTKFETTLPDSIKERESVLFKRISNSKGNNMTKLKILYSEMDKIYLHLNEITACKKGCYYCCFQEIAISELEVEFILKNTKAKRKKAANKAFNPEDPCSFLKSHKCSIYAHRPFLCRRHVSIADSSRWCERDVSNKFEFPLINFSEVDKSYAYLLTNSSRGNLHKNIRQIFREF
jgi:Fe-S-cluster containining protein